MLQRLEDALCVTALLFSLAVLIRAPWPTAHELFHPYPPGPHGTSTAR